MKSLIALALTATFALPSLAAEPTPQEQQFLAGVRQQYTQQTGRPPTPEEEEKMLVQWRAANLNMAITMARLSSMGKGGAPSAALMQGSQQQAMQAAPIAAMAALPTMTEEALAARLAAQGGPKSNLKIERVRDGLKIGGSMFLDPEGQVQSYAYDILNGDISYSIRSGDSMVYKYLRGGSGAEPVAFASARQSGGAWQVATVSGKTFSGDSVIALARGLMVARVGSAFIYEPGKGSRSAMVPEGWNMAQFQRGNVGATGFVLLERSVPPSEGRGSVGALMSSFKSLGAVAGISKKEDFALLQLETGKLYPLNIQSSGKNQSVMSNCRRRNALVNDCATMNTFESLYTDTGRNFGHYFWKADWYATPSGPLAVTMENGVADVYALDLASGKKVTLFHRALGITSFDSVQSSDATVAVSAKWVFEDHKVPDAAKFLQENAAAGAAQVAEK